MRGEPIHIENPSLEDYVAATRDALRRRDGALALEMVSAALTFDPAAPDLLELLSEVLPALPASLAKAPLDESAFFGTVAVRARIAADAGRLGTAIDAILAVAAFRPMIPYLRWLPGWLERSPTLRGVSAAGVAAGVARLLRVSEAGDGAPSQARAAASRGLRENFLCAGLLCRRLGDARSHHRPKLAVLESMILRRLDRPHDARERLEAVGASLTDVDVQIELATVLRELGDLKAARTTLRRAIEGGAAGPEPWLDLAATLLDAGDFAGAVDAANRARALADTEALRADAEAIAAHAEVLLDPADCVVRDRLRTLAASSPAAASRWRDVALCRAELAAPSDALAEVVRHAVERAKRDRPAQPLRVRLRTDSGVVAVRPSVGIATSARVAFVLGLRAAGLEGDLVGTDEAGASPATPLADVAADDDALDAAIAALAESKIDVDAWCTGAPTFDVRRAVLLACSLTSRRAPGSDPVDAFHRRAVAALCLAARGAQGDANVVTELARLACGKDPWLGSAAITALGGLARTSDASTRDAITAALEGVCQAAIDEDDARTIAALRVLCSIPGVPVDARGAWHARRVALERLLARGVER